MRLPRLKSGFGSIGGASQILTVVAVRLFSNWDSSIFLASWDLIFNANSCDVATILRKSVICLSCEVIFDTNWTTNVPSIDLVPSLILLIELPICITKALKLFALWKTCFLIFPNIVCNLYSSPSVLSKSLSITPSTGEFLINSSNGLSKNANVACLSGPPIQIFTICCNLS